MISNKAKNWLVIGSPKNWTTALSQPLPIWGLKLAYKNVFQSLSSGDLVWFYATLPVSGVIGFGIVRDKYIDNANLVWEEELKEKEVIWPLRFRIQVLKVISEEQWRTNSIKISDFNLFWQRGFQSLNEPHVKLLIERFEKIYGSVAKKDYFSGATITQPLLLREKPFKYKTTRKKETLSHRNLQEMIAEIGKLQFYHAQLEYPVELPGEKKNLDVVWKREISGVPTFAFEVELSRGVEKAIARLKFAYIQWNSRPRIVLPKRLFKTANNAVSTEDREFSQGLKMYEPSQMIDLLKRKRKLKKVEQNLEIY